MKTPIRLTASTLLLVLAGTASAARVVNLPCMQTAVESHYNAIIVAWDMQSAQIKTATSTYRDQLKAAWGNQDKRTRNDAIRGADTNYKRSVKAAKDQYRSLTKTADAEFRTRKNTCESHVNIQTNSSSSSSSSSQQNNQYLY